MTEAPFLATRDLTKSFQVGARTVPVLKGITLTIGKGEFVIIFGPSGCGKSTLLHCLLGLEPPTSGVVSLEGKDYYAGTEDDRATYRRHNVGVIYQQPLWIKSCNVMENLSFPLELMGKDEDTIIKKAHECLTRVGMDQWAGHNPAELSSGEQQKISLARALMMEPTLIVADEPTGNLDTVSGAELLKTFIEIVAAGKTIIMVTHDLEYLKYGTRLFHMIDGVVVETAQQKLNQAKRTVSGKGASEKFTGPNVRDPSFLKKIKK